MTVYTTAQVAEKLDTDARTLRKFLRATLDKDAQPGKGRRYSIEGKDIAPLKKQYGEWVAARTVAVDENEVDENES